MEACMRNKELIEDYWAGFDRDWVKMATFFSDSAHYTDVGLDAVGATGPEEIILRLRLGLSHWRDTSISLRIWFVKTIWL